ncbi:transcriptional regulatory protein NOT1 [Diplonema papillatum]|nr:transcriptional regulatory protein NOT1 [Diplonema papillatum]
MATGESNPHKLLMALLEKLGNKDVDTAVVQATYTAIKVLLASEKIRTNTSERSLLKNLGSWLGLQTIARNKPLMARDLDHKDRLRTTSNHPATSLAASHNTQALLISRP